MHTIRLYHQKSSKKFIGASLNEPHTNERAVSHRPPYGNLCSNMGKFMIKHEKQTLQVKATVKLNGIDYCTSLFGVSHHQCHGEV